MDSTGPVDFWNPHLDSFNHFVKTGIQNIVHANGVVTPLYSLRYTHLRIGEVERMIDGVWEPLTPQMCRITDTTYSAPIYVNIEYNNYKGHGQILKCRKKHVIIGYLPIMVKSCCCVLSGKNEKQLTKLGECPLDPGGYFIIKGYEKVILIQEQLSKNRIIIDKDDKGCIQASVVSSTEMIQTKTVIKMEESGEMSLFFRRFTTKVPILVVIKAMGMESRQEVEQMHGTDTRYRKLLLPSILDCEGKYGVVNQQQALEFLKSKLKYPCDEEHGALGVLRDLFLAHIPVNGNNFHPKCIYVSMMLKRMMDVILKKDEIDDRDYFGNKRLVISGNLISLLFEDLLKRVNNDVRKKVNCVEKKIAKGTSTCFDISTEILTISKGITDGLERAISTGNWDISRFKMNWKGVSQNLNRLSFIGSLASMRMIQPQLEKTRNVSKSQGLHPSQYGMICPTDTPEGKGCGLVKNLALATRITTHQEEGVIISLCYSCGVEELAKLAGEELNTQSSFLVMVNWHIIGKHRRQQVYGFVACSINKCCVLGSHYLFE